MSSFFSGLLLLNFFGWVSSWKRGPGGDQLIDFDSPRLSYGNFVKQSGRSVDFWTLMDLNCISSVVEMRKTFRYMSRCQVMRCHLRWFAEETGAWVSDRERKINESQTGITGFAHEQNEQRPRSGGDGIINQSIQTCLQVSQYVVSNLSAFQYSTPYPAREKNKTKNKHPHLSTLKKRDPSQCSKKNLLLPAPLQLQQPTTPNQQTTPFSWHKPKRKPPMKKQPPSDCLGMWITLCWARHVFSTRL